MTNIPNPKKIDVDKNLVSSGETQETPIPDEHDINITEGGEYLDDAIRMKEQPFMESKEQEET